MVVVLPPTAVKANGSGPVIEAPRAMPPFGHGGTNKVHQRHGELKALLDSPKDLESKIREYFKELARTPASRNRLVLCYEDMPALTKKLADELQTSASIFRDMDQLFYRFDASGDNMLDEEETVKLCFCMLRHFRDATGHPEPGAVRLGGKIKERNADDKFTIQNKLGEGGQGAVFLAVDKTSGQQVVMKMYDKSSPNVPVEDITKEFELLISLKHPRIANVFDIFQDVTNIYIVQEPYFGGDLTTAIQKANEKHVKVTELWLSRILRQVLEGVAFLHNNGVMHCDLKEANVMITNQTTTDLQQPKVVVIDFGLANKFASKSHPGGTPGYMPPEVWQYGLWTPKGDVFSLGVMVFSLRSGQQPYTQGCRSLEDVMRNTIDLFPTMAYGSEALAALVFKMLTKTFQQRPPVTAILEDPWLSQADDALQAIDDKVLRSLSEQREFREIRTALLADLASTSNLAQMRELNELFVKLDTDNTGVVTADDVRQGLMGKWPKDRVERLCQTLIGNDGELSYEEFMGQLIGATAPAENELLWRVFSQADGHQKGYLDKNDIENLLRRPVVQRVLGARDSAQLLHEMDVDGNGAISFEEFKATMQGQSAVQHLASQRAGNDPVIRKKRVWAGFAGRRWRPYQEGEEVEYYSVSQEAWVLCLIIAVSVQTGAIQVDVKPGYWIRGVELQTKVRRQKAGWFNGLLSAISPAALFVAPGCCSARR